MSYAYEQIALALHGWLRVEAGETATAITGKAIAVYALGADLTLGTGCAVESGDALEAGDVITQDSILPMPITALTVSSGTALLLREDASTSFSIA